ncbi:MAG: hypothetical protein JF606_21055 [Burkholderiales bacterium]|nr:hypothetical protein [Burkholderiales bacterium]
MGELLKLTWTQAARRRDEPDDAHLVAPAVEELEALHRLAKIGHMCSIREQAERLGELDAHLLPFADRLRSMADRFESRAILELIERLRNPLMQRLGRISIRILCFRYRGTAQASCLTIVRRRLITITGAF